MPRTADYTIQGFLYQFNKTMLEILRAQDDDKVTVEGIVEDIEVATPTTLTAVQCKYHEASTSCLQAIAPDDQTLFREPVREYSLYPLCPFFWSGYARPHN